MQKNFNHRFFVKKPAIERCIVDGGAKTKSYKSIWKSKSHAVGIWPGKHGNEAFLDYMLDSVFVGSK